MNRFIFACKVSPWFIRRIRASGSVVRRVYANFKHARNFQTSSSVNRRRNLPLRAYRINTINYKYDRWLVSFSLCILI